MTAPDAYGLIEFVRCECGWCVDIDEDTIYGPIAEAHTLECPSPMRGMKVPMWSIDWPYYHAEEKHWGIEIAWRPLGTHTTHPKPYLSGMDAKEWYCFPWPKVEQEVTA